MKSNQQLRQDVERQLAWETGVDDSHILVAVRHGSVTISGHVPSFRQKLDAIRAVERVDGVRVVADDLTVRLPESSIRDDSDIAESIAHHYAWNPAVPKHCVRGTVIDGTVILRGEVDWASQRREAERLARDVIGVRNVINLIELKPRPAVKSEIEKGIVKAFERQAAIDASRVHVAVHGSTAVLTGTVSSLTEKRAAILAASDAPGIARVESQLEVAALVDSGSR